MGRQLSGPSASPLGLRFTLPLGTAHQLQLPPQKETLSSMIKQKARFFKVAYVGLGLTLLREPPSQQKVKRQKEINKRGGVCKSPLPGPEFQNLKS